MPTHDEIDALWDIADPAATEQRLQSALNEVSDGVLRLEMQTQIARAQAC